MFPEGYQAGQVYCKPDNWALSSIQFRLRGYSLQTIRDYLQLNLSLDRLLDNRSRRVGRVSHEGSIWG